jgi:abortive infection bacteriophage resistance protein
VHFRDIVNLYLFNSIFRQLLFVQIEKVEVNLRCRLSNYFCEKYGVLGYEDVNNFTTPAYHDKFLNEIQRELVRNAKSPFVKNFRDNYDNKKIPLYAIIELFSFGTLSKFYKNMKNEDKKAVASLYGISYTYFESWIESMAYVRNICAHYGRLYNAKLSKTPRLYKKHTACGISNLRIFSTILTLRHLLPNDRHWSEFIQTIEMLIEKYPSVNLRLIGFPQEWTEKIK